MGNKLIFLGFLTLFLFTAAPVKAELIAGASANMHYTKSEAKLLGESQDYFVKKHAIKNYLEKIQSPMADQVDSFINACQKYNLDCYLLPSIAGVESSFGVYMASGTHNPFGWGRGLIPFESFDEAIMTVGKGLRENYIDKGAETVDQIGSIYCEGNTWSGKVKNFMGKFEKEENNLLFLSANTVQL